MKKYEHITEMETILDNHNNKIKELNESLDYLTDNMDAFNKLIAYYYSDLREADLKDEQDGLIEEGLKRGVLSEDAIYNLMSEYHSSCIKMLELTTNFFKHG